MKRFVCTLMALAMTMALALPAFATSVNSSNFATPAATGISQNLDGFTQVPTVKVYVPATTAANGLILNPYALPVQQSLIISGGTAEYTDQVISKPLFIGSLSDVPLNVTVKVVPTIPSNSKVVLSTASVVENTKLTNKSVFLWGQVVDAGTGATVPNIPTSFASEYDATEGKTGSMIQVGTAAGTTRTDIYQIPASASTTAFTNVNWACMRFFGDAVKAPAEAWTGNDVVKLAVTFTFTASMNEA